MSDLAAKGIIWDKLIVRKIFTAGKESCILLESPSKQLQKLLFDLKLCSVNDLRRCRRRVRRLVHDLPAFDSIWIDALVQARKLTSFQAKILESKHPKDIRVGPCLLVNRLGTGLSAATFLARRIDGNERCVLKQIEISSETVKQIEANLLALTSTARGLAHPSLVAPHAFNRVDRGRLAAISRYVPGPELSELVIRRGRFPSAVALVIGRQLLDGLAALESRGLAHGDIRTKNVRLTSAGVSVLVDAGIGPAIQPELVIYADVPPDRYDGIAPELIGMGKRANSASDLYAIGCLLWHLLAGRPPFPIGDPLARLAAHQTRSIQDVRQWAPDTPEFLAEAIQWFTIRDPSQRPQSAREALMGLGPPSRWDRRRLEKFRVMFNTSAPRVPAHLSPSSSRWPFLLAALCVVSGAVLTLFDHGARSHFLHIVSQVSDVLPAVGMTSSVNSKLGATRSYGAETPTILASGTNEKLRSIPAPNAEGVIFLEPGSSYRVAEISHVGALVIRSVATQKVLDNHGLIRLAEIVVTDTPLKVCTEQLTVEGVHFRSTLSTPTVPDTLLLVQAQNVTIRQCRFQTALNDLASDPHVAGRCPVALVWKSIDPNEHSGRNLLLKDSIFIGSSSVVYSVDAPQEVRCLNCLKVGPGAFLSLGPNAMVKGDISVKLQSLTLRQAGALLRMTARKTSMGEKKLNSAKSFCQIVIDADDCVFDLDHSNVALFEWSGTPPLTDQLKLIQMNGKGSLANPELIVAAWMDPMNGQRTIMDSNAVQVEGISTGPFQFVGPAGSSVQDSAIKTHQAPRRSSSDPPGIDVSRLPRTKESEESARKSADNRPVDD